MKIKRHHSSTTRNLHRALALLESAKAALLDARELLAQEGNPDSLNPGTFGALFELTRGRDGNGEACPNGADTIERLRAMVLASAEQDDAVKKDAR